MRSFGPMTTLSLLPIVTDSGSEATVIVVVAAFGHAPAAKSLMS